MFVLWQAPCRFRDRMVIMIETVMHWIAIHGYIVIFGLFALGIIGLPVPNELLLGYLGFLVYKGQLGAVPTVAAALSGSLAGMIFNYMLGRTAGYYLVGKFGVFFHITQERILEMHNWFERRGRWALLVGYFFPGVRHVTAFAAGTSKIGLGEFAVFTAVGAGIWTTLFIALGFFMEDEWSKTTETIHRLLIISSGLVVVFFAGYFIYNKRKTKNN